MALGGASHKGGGNWKPCYHSIGFKVSGLKLGSKFRPTVAYSFKPTLNAEPTACAPLTILS